MEHTYWPKKEELNAWVRILAYFEEDIDNDKFSNFYSKNISELIKPSLGDNYYKGKSKLFRRRLNKTFKNIATLLLYKDNFIEDLMALVEESDLSDKKYKFDPYYLFEKSIPTVNAWYCRLEYSSYLMMIKDKEKNEKLSLVDLIKRNNLQKVFDDKLDIFMDSYGLEFYWRDSIILLMLTGVWYLPKHSSFIHLKLRDDGRTAFNPSLSLEISSITTKEEVGYRWSEIEDLRNDFYFTKRGKRLKPMEMDKELFDHLNSDTPWDVGKTKMESSVVKRRRFDRSRKKSVRAKESLKKFLTADKKLPDYIKKRIIYGERASDEIIFS